MSIRGTPGLRPGEKGGVPGLLLMVAADVRFRMREVEKPGDLMLDEPEVREDFDCEALSVGASVFGALSLREKRPISAD